MARCVITRGRSRSAMHMPLPRHAGAVKSDFVLQLRSNLAQFRRLDRLKQYILLGLVLMGTIISLATLLYIFEPANVADASGPLRMPAVATATLPPNIPAVSGLFAIQDAATAAPSLLELHQFGMSLTGTLTTAACAGSESLNTVDIVTGHFLSDGSLSFTISDPAAPQSVT